MSQLITYVADGLAMGSLYGLLALALVIVYRATRLINFAQGELAMLSTYVTYSLLQRVSPWIAVPISLVVAFVFGALVEVVLMRRLKDGRELNAVIITVGLLTVVNSVVLWLYGSIPQAFPSPFGEEVVRVGDAVISRQALGACLTSLAVVGVLALLFRFTTLGLALRATAQNWLAARLVGVRVERMFSIGWGLASVMGAIAGLLVAPKVFLFPSMMQAILVYAFAAAVVGGLDSPVGAVVGGLLVGVIESLAAGWEPIGSDLKTVVAMAVLVAVLVVRPTGLFGRPTARKV